MKQESEQYTKWAIQVQDKINILAITWNLFGSLPPVNSLIQLSQSNSFSTTPDLIFFGTQECERSLCLSFCCQDKKQWENMLVETFNQYSLLVTETMGGLHSAILVKNKIKDYFYFQQRQFIKAGFCNLLGNKGAIGIEISLLGQSFQFINCHLAANQQQTQHRNQTIERILSNLVSKNTRTEVIFLGDFNYRIEMTNQSYQAMIHKKVNTDQRMNYKSFFENEQLTNQIVLQNNFLVKFEEGKIFFPPTYKISIDSQQYNRERIPGWTDRIFNRRSKQITRTVYCCEYAIMGSDHRPVLAAFQLHTNQVGFSLTNETFVRVKSSKCQII